MDSKQILAFDKAHVWHPYTSATSEEDCLLVEKAEGVFIELESGERLIDGMSSWWSVIHGYNHPALNRAITEQCSQMAHLMFGGLTHRPAVNLANALLEIVPKGLKYVFYSDSGSVAVEVALKMAMQYWQSQHKSGKNQFVTIKNGYHGDTWHAMSVCDPVTGMHHIFNNRLSVQHFLSSPKSVYGKAFDQSEMVPVSEFLQENHSHLAAFILEPIVQGAGGMRFYHPEYLKQLYLLCKQFNVLLIADEIATGFGRTGKLFACEHAEISPDIMCIGKALTGGYMSFAATLCSDEIAQTISKGEPGVFMHGPTFMGNPLACATALASIQLLKKNRYNTAHIEQQLKQGLSSLSNMEAVADVRCLGAIGVVEMKENVDMGAIQKECMRQGIWLRPFGKLVYTMPPFIISTDELSALILGIRNVIRKIYA
ncbi:adenosylmethionine-8-amino-7-oxononanoate aminotransferase [Saccharicrinis fermentans DSM 9555 = JCM 21142]|uniref:Adenosylmethionine-8-amino-7-oxononanoate aminotransferase n=2 Tax=Saccharicrinis fermentans TaxID=982 RepID=W7YA70_9BACT|nr:adenosylmethionine-8-amino-7-oxononanoate aminotransferase [Saccharicrinis fermentans DSM 9555 = JCM 21142]